MYIITSYYWYSPFSTVNAVIPQCKMSRNARKIIKSIHYAECAVQDVTLLSTYCIMHVIFDPNM